MRIIRHPVSTPNVHPWERVASVVSGGALAMLGAKKGRPGMPMLAAAAALLQRGLTGHCYMYQAFGVRTAPQGQGKSTSVPYELGVWAETEITIQRPRKEVYQFWRNFANLPRFMGHLESVEVKDSRRSRWVAKGPAGTRVAWDAEIINEIPNELLAWRSLDGSDVDSAGSVHFRDTPGKRGTRIQVELQYNPPAGLVGAYVARLFGREPEQEIRADLEGLKKYMETGKFPKREREQAPQKIEAKAGERASRHRQAV